MDFRETLSGKLIAIMGQAGSGKDTAAQVICDLVRGAETIAFADPLKKFCKLAFDFSDEQLWGPSEARNAPDPRYTREDGEPLTPRYALQTLGTEWGRHCYPDVWVDCGIRTAASVIQLGCPLVLITDCRFTNEAKIVKAQGGLVWRIERPELSQGLDAAAQAHSSETQQQSEEMDALVDLTIVNDGTLDDLREALRVALANLSGH